MTTETTLELQIGTNMQAFQRQLATIDDSTYDTIRLPTGPISRLPTREDFLPDTPPSPYHIPDDNVYARKRFLEFNDDVGLCIKQVEYAARNNNPVLRINSPEPLDGASLFGNPYVFNDRAGWEPGHLIHALNMTTDGNVLFHIDAPISDLTHIALHTFLTSELTVELYSDLNTTTTANLDNLTTITNPVPTTDIPTE